MGQPVPADDLPSAGGAAVPPDDLPVTGTPAATSKPEEDFLTQQFVGPAEAATSFATGLVAQPVSGLLGLGQGLRNVLAPVTGNPEGIPAADVVRKAQEAFTYQPRTQRGKDIMEVAGIPGEVVTNIAGKVGERGAEVSPVLGTIGHTSVEALPALIGFRGALKPAPKLTPKQVQAGQAMDAGFRLTPEEMGAGPVARTMASVSGEPRLGKLNTKKNQPLVNDKIAADLGLSKGSPLDIDTLQRIRGEASKAYEAVRGAGTIFTDQQYLADLAKIGDKYQTVAKDFPEVSAKTGAAEAQAIVEGLKKQAFDANSAVDLINQLRRSADDAFRSSRTDVAKAMRDGAVAVEGMLDRALQQGASVGMNAPDAVAAFRAARERIAKTYVAEKALVGDNINPQVYAKEARKGKPLTGEALEVGKAADKYERSLQKPTHQATGPSFWDVALPALWGGIKELALLGARPGMRNVLASRPGQFMMDPRTNISGPTQATLGFGSVPRPQEETR